MWAAGSIDAMRDHYISEGRRIESGIWSVLLAEMESDSIEFAERYYHRFNELSLGVWHLNVFANFDPGTGVWARDTSLHQRSQELRQKIQTATGKALPRMCIVFLSGPSFLNEEVDLKSETVWAIFPLDHNNISATNLYMAGLEATQVAITRCYNELNIERYDPITLEQSNKLITLLQKKLASKVRNKVLACYLAKPLKWTALTLLSAAFGLPVAALAALVGVQPPE